MRSTIVMTGASRGIGRSTAGHILRRAPGVRLVVLGRTPTAPDAGEIVHIATDLGSLRSVREGAAAVRERLASGALPPLRGIVANAGVQHTDALTESADGFEATFAVNVLAHHLLVRLLQDRLTPPARVVVTVSDTHFGDVRHNLGMVPGPRWREPDALARPGAFPKPASTGAGRTAYSTSKLAAVHLVHEYARRLPAGIDAVAYNPGLVPGTGLARNAGPLARFAMRRILPALAATPLATGPGTAGRRLADVVLGAIAAPTGSYVDRRRPARSSAASYDPARERELWDAAERLTAGTA
ncbi:SDR family NAD(P)-dependent oxidoreductase [Actinomadura parmotrematis]|uniref:SDR family NAD(P)-dependent oxidoreductase n=1 Tax=Actinomadura parmotrematis TaxID=2864039 RepID=A0ABS7G203_9ACTN|nr:SDR family NAD(P)-dependent oxidoreductase [Actinomadura parmotrematis]MBW8485678.1 SDR family NAD(P)-dependent oxidoreductase [Actinomadura parmotrematis]